MLMKRLQNLAALASRPRPPVGTTPADVIHSENKWRLLRYRARELRHATPILLVPSLINRHYVLDLLPGKSFAEYLVAQGHDVHIIDWGTPGPEDRYLTLDDIFDRYLGRAVRLTAQSSPDAKTHVLGYCMGGIMASIYASVRPEHVATLSTLAAPVQFGGDGLLGAWTRSKSFDVGAIIDAFGNVPWQLMQSAFNMLRPTLGMSKAVHMIDRAWDDEFLNGFLALETWGNDNVAFPGECYRRYITELYQGDALARGTFTLSGLPARLENIRCPTLAVTFEHDNVVPWQSAKELVLRVGATDKEWLHLPGGHVGAVVSRSAAKGLWPKLSAWWAARDAARPAHASTKRRRAEREASRKP